VAFQLQALEVTVLNVDREFKFNEALASSTEAQEEVDELWEKLSNVEK
jgi:predicted 3-demethylubiquinone-9 3-methyltransferase (glyoxalase superfamily)